MPICAKATAFARSTVIRRFSDASAMVARPVHDFDGAFQSMVVREASTSPGMFSRTTPSPPKQRTKRRPPSAPFTSQCASANSFAWVQSTKKAKLVLSCLWFPFGPGGAYILAFGGLLLFGGWVGDLFGRRRVFRGPDRQPLGSWTKGRPPRPPVAPPAADHDARRRHPAVDLLRNLGGKRPGVSNARRAAIPD
jgi:hypothetical protein